MSERITKAQLNERCVNLNRRLRETGRHVQLQGRNGHIALDEYEGTTAIRTIIVGTKREIYDFVHAMMVGIDLRHVRSSALVDAAQADAQAFFGRPASQLEPAKLTAALGVVVFDPINRAAIDPQALKQARVALNLDEEA